MRRAVRPRTSARTSPGYSASTPSHASIRLEKSVHMLSIGKLEPNIARPEPKVSSTTLVTSAISSGSTRCMNVPWPESFTQTFGRCASCVSASRQGSPAIGMPAWISTKVRSGCASTSCSAESSWFGKTCSSNSRPALGNSARLRVEGPGRARGPARSRSGTARARASAAAAGVPRSSGLALAGRRSSSSASGANRSAEPTIACGQPVRLVLRLHPLDLLERVAPAASWPARRPTARSRAASASAL